MSYRTQNGGWSFAKQLKLRKMKKLLLIIAVVSSGLLMQAQSHTFSNNHGAAYISGQTGDFSEFPMRWIISNAGNGNYNIYYSICLCGQCSLEVKYSHFDLSKKMHIYVPVDSEYFEGDTVKYVMSSGKLSEYSNGIAPKDMNVLGIVFTDDTGLIYALSD